MVRKRDVCFWVQVLLLLCGVGGCYGGDNETDAPAPPTTPTPPTPTDSTSTSTSGSGSGSDSGKIEPWAMVLFGVGVGTAAIACVYMIQKREAATRQRISEGMASAAVQRHTESNNNQDLYLSRGSPLTYQSDSLNGTKTSPLTLPKEKPDESETPSQSLKDPEQSFSMNEQEVLSEESAANRIYTPAELTLPRQGQGQRRMKWDGRQESADVESFAVAETESSPTNASTVGRRRLQMNRRPQLASLVESAPSSPATSLNREELISLVEAIDGKTDSPVSSIPPSVSDRPRRIGLRSPAQRAAQGLPPRD